MVKNPPANVGDVIILLGQEETLEEKVAATPIFLPGKFHGHRSLVGYNSRGHKESDMTEGLSTWYMGRKMQIHYYKELETIKKSQLKLENSIAKMKAELKAINIKLYIKE